MYPETFSLQAKRIIVTGASSGIGKSTALKCVSFGGDVLAIGRNEERLSHLNDMACGISGGGILLPITLDLTDFRKIEEFTSNLSGIDGIVLNAGIDRIVPNKFADPVSVESIFNLNLYANIELIRQLVKNRLLNKGASIVAIGSISGIKHHSIGKGIYSASKAALASWMKTLALELAPKGIRANTICPGAINTEMVQSIMTEEQIKNDADKYPLKRYGHPEEVANAVVFLLSDASKFITGTEIIIDGGRTLGG